MKNKLRTICVGDIHGCLEEFKELLLKIQYNKELDRIILLGDLIDRGDFSAETVKFARELNLECVMGNHEFKFLKWFNSNKKIFTKENFYEKLSSEDIDYIFKMPNYIKINNFIAVHAGLKAGVSIENQKREDLLYIRYSDKYGNFISLKDINKKKSYFWTKFWKGPESIIYGHNVHSFSEPLIEEVSTDVICYGLDTGCCFGGKLTGLILETKELIQVKAKKVYFKSKF